MAASRGSLVYRSQAADDGVRGRSRIARASRIVTLPADDRSNPAGMPGRGRRALRRYAPLVIVVALIGLAYGLGLHRELSFETLVRHRAAIDRFIDQHEIAAGRWPGPPSSS
jgi:hypothetical protein